MQRALFFMLALSLTACAGGTAQNSLPVQSLPESASGTRVLSSYASPAFATYPPITSFTHTGYPQSLAADGAGNIWYSSRSAFERISATSTTVVGVGVPVSGVFLANLTRGRDGNVYALGGYGNISFMDRLSPTGVRTVLPLHGLTRDAYVQNQLMTGNDGYLYAFVQDTANDPFRWDILKITTSGSVLAQPQVFPTSNRFDELALENATMDPKTNTIFAAMSINRDGFNVLRYTTSGTLLHSYKILNQTLSTGIAGMTMAPDGNLWLTTIQRTCNIVRLNLTTSAQTCFTAPSVHGNLRQIAVGNDLKLYFGDEDHAVGRMTTAGAITIFNRPTGNFGLIAVPPYNATAHAPGSVWFADDNYYTANYVVTSLTY